MAAIVRHERYQVVVVGGGPAGVCAAVASARAGRKTLLIEQYGFLGGMGTTALLLPWKGMLPHEPAFPQSLAAEIVARLEKKGACRKITEGHAFSVMVDQEAFKACVQEFVLDAEAELLMHTRFIHAACTKTRVTSITVQCREGAVEIAGDVFIDATGTGELAASCGEQYVLADDPVSCRFFMLNVDIDAFTHFHHHHRGSFSQFEAQWRLSSSLLHAKTSIDLIQGMIPSSVLVGMIELHGGDILTIDGIARAEIAAQQLVPKAELFLRMNIPGFELAQRGAMPAQIGLHGTRVFETHVPAGFDDAVIPVAVPDALDERAALPIDAIRASRCTNLLLAGRMLLQPSLLYSTNNQPASMALGEAAGLLAVTL